MQTDEQPELSNSEPLITIPCAADELGIPVSALRRAVKKGLVPVEFAFSGRARVRLSVVVAAIASYSSGGRNNG